MTEISRTGRDASLKNQIYEVMLDEILLGHFVPEQPFTEKSLVEKFNVSKSPIREALIELCNENVLRSIPRYGYEVLRISKSDVENAKEARIILECGALERYFDKISKEDVAELRILLEVKGSSISLPAHWNRNSDFHLALAACYENRYVSSSLSSLLILMRRAYVQYQYNKHKKLEFGSNAHHHSDILDAIERNDKEAAVKGLKADIEAFETNLIN